MKSALSSATLVDYGLITKENTNLVVDKSKIRRCRQIERKQNLQNVSFDHIQGIHFDGRIDETIVWTNDRKQESKEDHIAFVRQPNSYYIGHKTIPAGSAGHHLIALIELCRERNIPLNRICVIGCDGTAVNTGCDSCVIRLFELDNGPVQWAICMLHMNEFPLRALIEGCDGKFNSKNKLIGPIGARLNDCEKLPIVEFEPIHFPHIHRSRFCSSRIQH